MPKPKLVSARDSSIEKNKINVKREHYGEVVVKKEKFTDSEDEDKKKKIRKRNLIRNRVRNLRKTHHQKSLIVVSQKKKRRRNVGGKGRVILEVVGSLYYLRDMTGQHL